VFVESVFDTSWLQQALQPSECEVIRKRVAPAEDFCTTTRLFNGIKRLLRRTQGVISCGNTQHNFNLWILTAKSRPQKQIVEQQDQ